MRLLQISPFLYSTPRCRHAHNGVQMLSGSLALVNKPHSLTLPFAGKGMECQQILKWCWSDKRLHRSIRGSISHRQDRHLRHAT